METPESKAEVCAGLVQLSWLICPRCQQSLVHEPLFSTGLWEPPMSSSYKNHFPSQLAGRFCKNASMPSAASSKRRLHAITSLATS